MLLDGAPATPPDVAKRLHDFWLPNEPVLFIGRSAKAVGSRVAAIYATPLGDARPYSAANWLKTLSVINELRIWWSETDAHEEHEDALLTDIAARNDGRTPFANLMAADGTPKATGLANSMRAAADQPTNTKKPTARRSAGSTSRAQPATRTRKPAPPKSAPPRPTAAPTLVSQEGLEKLLAESRICAPSSGR